MFGIGDLITIDDNRYFLDNIKEDGTLIFKPVQDKKVDWDWQKLLGKTIKDKTGKEHKVVKVNDDNRGEIWLTLDNNGYRPSLSRFTDKEDFDKRFILAKIIRGKEMKKEQYNIPEKSQKKVSITNNLHQIESFGENLKVHFDEKFRTAKIEISDAVAKKTVAQLHPIANVKFSESSESKNTANGSIAYNGYDISYTWADMEDTWKNIGKTAQKNIDGKIEIVNNKLEIIACVAGSYEDFEDICDKLTPNEKVLECLGFRKKDGKYTKVASGDLVIEDRDGIAVDSQTFGDALDRLGYIGNGYDFFDDSDNLYIATNKEFSIGLTNAPVIVKGGYYADDGKYVVPEDAEVYVFVGYETLDELKILQENGEVAFTRLEDKEEKKADEYDNGDNIVTNGSKKTAEIVQQTTNVFFDNVQEMIEYNQKTNNDGTESETQKEEIPADTNTTDTNIENIDENKEIKVDDTINNGESTENSNIEITPSSKKEDGTQKEAEGDDKKEPQESADKYDLKGLIIDLKNYPIFNRMTETEALNTLNEQYAVAINKENGNSAIVKSNLLKNPFFYADELKKVKEQSLQNAPVEAQAQEDGTVIKQRLASKQVVCSFNGTKKESDLFKKALRQNGVKICGFNKKAEVVLDGVTEYTAHLDINDLVKLVLDETLLASTNSLKDCEEKVINAIKDIVDDIRAVSIEFNDADVKDIEINTTKSEISVNDTDEEIKEAIGDFIYSKREKLGLNDKVNVDMNAEELADIYFANKKTSSKKASKGDAEFDYLRSQLMPKIMVNELGEQEEKAFASIWEQYHDKDMNYLSENLVQIGKEFNEKLEELKQNKQSDKFIGENLGAEPAMSDDPDIKKEQPFVDDNGMNFSKYQSKNDIWENEHSREEMEEVIFKDLVFMILESGFTPKEAVNNIMKDYNIPFDWVYDFYWKWNKAGRPLDFNVMSSKEASNKKAYKNLGTDNWGHWFLTIDTNGKEETDKIVDKLENSTKTENLNFIKINSEGENWISIIWNAPTAEEAIADAIKFLESKDIKKDASKIKVIEKTAKTDPAYKSMEDNLKKEKVKGKCPNCGKNTLIKKKDGIRTLREWVECTNCTLAFETDKPKKDDGYLVENGIWEDTNKERALTRSASKKTASMGAVPEIWNKYKNIKNKPEVVIIQKGNGDIHLVIEGTAEILAVFSGEDANESVATEWAEDNGFKILAFFVSKQASQIFEGDSVVVSPQGKAESKYQGQIGKVVSVGQDKYEVKVDNEVLKLDKSDIYIAPKEANKTEDKEAVKKKSKRQKQVSSKEKASKESKENISKKASSEVEKEIRGKIFSGADAYTHKDVWDKTIDRVIENWVIGAEEKYEGKWTEESDTGAKYPSDKNDYEAHIDNYLEEHIDDIVEEITISGEDEIRKKNASNKISDKDKEEKLKKLHDELDEYIKSQEKKNPNFDTEKDARAMQLKREIDDLENNKESYIEWEQICQNDKKDFKSRIPRNRDWSTPNEEGIIPSEMQS